jgi:hypothetical protein
MAEAVSFEKSNTLIHCYVGPSVLPFAERKYSVPHTPFLKQG